MNNRWSKALVPGVLILSSLFALYISTYRPGYLSSTYYLGTFLFLQVLLAAVWNYRQRFFPLLLTVFFWAGTAIPFGAVWTAGRWVVLGVGALAGYVIYMKDRHHYFSTIQLLALFCVLAALVSAVVSSFPGTASLKSLSLLLLFLYGSAGARLAMVGREEKFFDGLLLAVEIVVYLSAAAYFLLHLAVYGNPNSLGAVMGVVAMPLLLWRTLTSEATPARRRRGFAFLLCLFLLFFSQARAGMVAGVVSCGLLCLALRRYRLLVQGSMVCVLMAVLAIVVTPPAGDDTDMPARQAGSSLSSIFLYKGHEEGGFFASRRSAWDQTATVIREHPWFGSGFGTWSSGDPEEVQAGIYSSHSKTTREHGNSYLAIMEWVGLLGVMPFLALVALLATNVVRVLTQLRRSGNSRNFAVPIALVLAAGLVHAAFEDWLFAVGYYLCVFFWVFAFALFDFLPAKALSTHHTARWTTQPYSHGFGTAAPDR